MSVYFAMKPMPSTVDEEPRLHQPIGHTSGLDVDGLARLLAADGSADLATALSAHLSEEERLIAVVRPQPQVRGSHRLYQPSAASAL